jgi:DNA-binding MarR family transcriptional regulator
MTRVLAPLPFDPIAEAQRNWKASGWAPAASGMAAVTSVMRAQQLLLRRADDLLAPYDLTFARYEVLALLGFSRRGSLPMSKIGARLQVHPASVTNAVDRLEAQELVTRLPHPTDGRTTLARITGNGRRVRRAATSALNSELFTNLPLTSNELAQLFDLLRKVREAAGDFAR